MVESTPVHVGCKLCSGCGRIKPIKDFPGGKGRCKQCRNDYQRQRYASNSEVRRAAAEIRERNREKNRLYAAEYYRANREKMIADAREYAKRNPPNPERTRELSRLRDAARKRAAVRCSIDGCGRPIRNVALQLCYVHNRRYQRDGVLGGEIRQRAAGTIPTGTICMLDDCSKPYHANGFCKMHDRVNRWRENPESAETGTAAARRRRARKRKLPSEPYTLSDIIARDGADCVLCGDTIDLNLTWPDTGSVTVDHLEPLSWPDSAGDVLSNVSAAHLGCNNARRDRPHPAAARKRAELLALERAAEAAM